MTFHSINKINGSIPPDVSAHSAMSPQWSCSFCHICGWTETCFLLINAVLSTPQGKCACIPMVRGVPMFPHHAIGKVEVRGGVRGTETFSLQLCPYSQHLTRGPDVNKSYNHNLSNASPQWDRSTCKCSPTLRHDSIIAGLTSLNLLITNLIVANKDRQTEECCKIGFRFVFSRAHNTQRSDDTQLLLTVKHKSLY